MFHLGLTVLFSQGAIRRTRDIQCDSLTSEQAFK